MTLEFPPEPLPAHIELCCRRCGTYFRRSEQHTDARCAERLSSELDRARYEAREWKRRGLAMVWSMLLSMVSFFAILLWSEWGA